MSDFKFTILDDDLIEAGLDGYVKSSNNYYPIYPLKSNERRKVYFVTDPWTAKNDRSWMSYRAVAAFEGLRGGYQLPNGCKEFPVFDQVIVEGADGKRYRQGAADPILALVAPSVKYPPKNGKVSGTDKYAVNVIDEEGNHIILTMSAKRGTELVNQLKNFRELDENFTATKYPFLLEITGGTGSYSLTCKPLPKEPPIELPEPYNIEEIMVSIRQQVEDFVASLTGGSTREDDVVDEDEVVDSFEETVSSEQADYATMSAIRLKSLLSQSGVQVPPRATHSALVELANAHL